MRSSLTVEEVQPSEEREQDEEDVKSSKDSSEDQEGSGEGFLPVTEGSCQIFHFSPHFFKILHILFF